MKIPLALTFSFFLMQVRTLVIKPGKVSFRYNTAQHLSRKVPETSPEPRKFYVPPSKLLDIAASAVQFALRLGSGAFVSGYNFRIDDIKDDEYSFVKAFGKGIRETSTTNTIQPKLPIALYEFEGCPFCRKVREAVSILDLDVLFYPCPKGGPTYRPKVQEMGGKQQFPYMVDPNTEVAIYESADIIQYLFDTYANGTSVPASLSKSFASTFTAGLGLLPRFGRGSRFEEAKPAKQPLVLWAYEASPFCKIVRERLCELEIPHLFKSCARGSSKRALLLEKVGVFQVPFLEDPNTGVAMFESDEIIKYIDKTYSFRVVA